MQILTLNNFFSLSRFARCHIYTTSSKKQRSKKVFYVLRTAVRFVCILMLGLLSVLFLRVFFTSRSAATTSEGILALQWSRHTRYIHTHTHTHTGTIRTEIEEKKNK